jgi:hypothetical protein
MSDAQVCSATRLDGVESLLQEIAANGQALIRGQDAARTTLIGKARSLIAALETPTEMVTWIAWAEVPKPPLKVSKVLLYGNLIPLLAHETSCAAHRH